MAKKTKVYRFIFADGTGTWMFYKPNRMEKITMEQEHGKIVKMDIMYM